MPREVNLQGYIIKTQDLNEADLLLTFFSRELGKSRFLAKSAKKMMSKLRGRLQPNCLIEVTLTSQGSLPLVINSEVIKSYPEVINHQDSIQVALAIQEIILKSLPDELPNENLYLSLTNALESLDSEKGKNSVLVLLKFLNDALLSLGFAPSLLSLKTELPNQIFYNFSEGRFKDQYLSASDQVISNNAYQLLLNLQSLSPKDIIQSSPGKELLKVLTGFLTYHLERDLKASDYFLHQLA